MRNNILFIGLVAILFLAGCENEPTSNTIAQSNKDPVANAGYDLYVSVGQKFNFDGSATDSDGKIISYEWDVDSDGTYDTFCKGCGKDSYTFEKSGTYTARLKVTDDDGATGTDEMTIVVIE